MKEGLHFRFWRMMARLRMPQRAVGVDVRLSKTVDAISTVLGWAAFAASFPMLVVLLLYAGFDEADLDKQMLVRIMRSGQVVFLVNIFFNLIFRFRRIAAESRIIKRLAILAMILSLLPAVASLFPGSRNYHFLYGMEWLVIPLAFYSTADIIYGTMQMLGRRTNPSLILSGSFLFFILIGSFVLMLPRCTTGSISYVDSLFMAASAVSMTGLCTVDIATEFTPLGWLVIAVLIQIGALGVLTFTSFFALFFSGRNTIYSQLMMRDFIYSKSIGGLVPAILYILVFTVIVETAGAVAIYFTLPDGFLGSTHDRIIFAAFHSLSAFCNGGFSTVQGGMANPALLQSNQSIYLVMSVLILAGGIGFPILVNFKDVIAERLRRLRARLRGRHIERKVHVYDLNSKLVLIFSALLFLLGAVSFYIFEYNHAFQNLPWTKRAIQSVFCSCTVRSAGFSTYGPSEWMPVTFLVAMFLMWVGCASQSMGGGIKVNTLAAVMLNLRAIIFGQRGVTIFNRSIALSSIRRANAVVFFSILAVLFYSMALMVLQPELPMKSVMFEAFSAITTIGMSLGITPELSDISKITVCTAMFLGRVGIISVLCGIVGDKPDISGMLPADDIIIN